MRTGGGSVRPFGVAPRGPAVYDPSAELPASEWRDEIGNPDRYKPLGWGAVDDVDAVIAPEGEVVAPKAPPRSAGHGRVGPGKLEADAAKAAAQAAYEASIVRPTDPDPNWESRFVGKDAAAPPSNGGEMRRNLVPSGANNMFNGLDPSTAFSGRDPQLETFMHNVLILMLI